MAFVPQLSRPKYSDVFAIFHYLRSQSNTSLEVFWDNDLLVKPNVWLLLRDLGSIGIHRGCLRDFQSWLDICKAVMFDFNTESINFLEWTITEVIDGVGPAPMHTLQASETDFQRIFDLLVQHRVGDSHMPTRHFIPVGYAAGHLLAAIRDIEYTVQMALGKDISEQYRRHWDSPEQVERALAFCEHVISVGISERPDSVFDTVSIPVRFKNSARDVIKRVPIFWLFNKYKLGLNWARILKKNGLDPMWVLKETQRRMDIAETSAHDISACVGASQMQQTRRRTFKRRLSNSSVAHPDADLPCPVDESANGLNYTTLRVQLSPRTQIPCVVRLAR